MTCAKLTTIAILVKGKRFWVGTNKCNNPQKICPRKPYENYDKCKTICKQKYHAEVDVCNKAKEKGRGGTLYLIGHNRICKECEKELKRYNIKLKFCINNDIKRRKTTRRTITR